MKPTELCPKTLEALFEASDQLEKYLDEYLDTLEVPGKVKEAIAQLQYTQVLVYSDSDDFQAAGYVNEVQSTIQAITELSSWLAGELDGVSKTNPIDEPAELGEPGRIEDDNEEPPLDGELP